MRPAPTSRSISHSTAWRSSTESRPRAARTTRRWSSCTRSWTKSCPRRTARRPCCAPWTARRRRRQGRRRGSARRMSQSSRRSCRCSRRSRRRSGAKSRSRARVRSGSWDAAWTLDGACIPGSRACALGRRCFLFGFFCCCCSCALLYFARGVANLVLMRDDIRGASRPAAARPLTYLLTHVSLHVPR